MAVCPTRDFVVPVRVDQEVPSTAQSVFGYGDKNSHLLAWLSRGQFTTAHIGRMGDPAGGLLSSLDDISR